MSDQIDNYDYEKLCPEAFNLGFYKTSKEYVYFTKLHLLVLDSSSLKSIYNVKGERNVQIFQRLKKNYISVFKFLYEKLDRNKLGKIEDIILETDEYRNDYKEFFSELYMAIDGNLAEISQKNEIYDRKMISIFSLNFLTEEQKTNILINDCFIEFIYSQNDILMLHNVIQLIQVSELYINRTKLNMNKDNYILEKVYMMYHQIMKRLNSENILDNFFNELSEINHINVIISFLNSIFTAGINSYINKMNEDITNESLDIIRSVFM